MDVYFLDTNILLRFFIQDNQTQFNKAKSYFSQARQRKIKLVLIPQIIIEFEYVLRKVYEQPKSFIYVQLKKIVNLTYIELRDQKIMRATIQIYKQFSIDFIDAYLFVTADQEFASVLSFDKDFKKIK